MLTDIFAYRYANAWIDLGIGQFSGEAPCRIEFEAPGTGDRQWDFGDGATATGDHVSHVYTEPGSYQVAARQGAKVVRGTVTVGPRIPPRLADVKVLDSTHVLLRFSERMSFDVASAAFGSGAVVVSFGPDPADDLGGIIITADPLPTNDTLTLSGLTDLAQAPSALEAVTVNISRAPWPSHCEGLVWLWETATADNVFWHPADRMQMTTELVLGGPAWLPPSTARFDRFGVLRTGRQCIANFRPGANDAIARGLTTGINADQRAVSIEMTITPDDLQQMPDHRLGAVISAMSWSFPNGVRHLAQKGDGLQ